MPVAFVMSDNEVALYPFVLKMDMAFEIIRFLVDSGFLTLQIYRSVY